MTKLSTVHALLHSMLRHANGKRILRVHILIGELSTYTEDTIRSQWEEITKDTLAEDARLHFRRAAAELQCMACFGKYHPLNKEVKCPICGSVGAKVLTGEELSLEEIELE